MAQSETEKWLWEENGALRVRLRQAVRRLEVLGQVELVAELTGQPTAGPNGVNAKEVLNACANS